MRPICVLGLELRERRVVAADEAQLRVRQAEGRQVELRAVLQYLHAVGKVVATPGVRQATRAPPLREPRAQRPVSVVRVGRPGSPRRAAIRGQSRFGRKR